MSNVKYYYDSETLSYRPITKSNTKMAKYLFGFLLASCLFGLLIVFIGSYYFESPREKALNRELQNMELQELNLILREEIAGLLSEINSCKHKK